jgi:hypothetical protein
VPFVRVTADEAYGQAKWLQAWLEGQDVWYVMAIRCSDTLSMPEGERRADALIGAVPPQGLAADPGRLSPLARRGQPAAGTAPGPAGSRPITLVNHLGCR